MLITNMFNSLIKSEKFFRIVYPHLKSEYFPEVPDKQVLKKIGIFYEQYNRVPNLADVKLMVDQDNDLSVETSAEIIKRLVEIHKVERVTDENFLIDEVEKFVQNRALENAIMSSVEILQDETKARGSIREKIDEALAIQFIVNVGHDYIMDAEERLESYSEVEESIPLDILKINEAMGGGLVKKSLFLYAAPPNKGKTLWMCHNAASLLKSGQNVLYISSEMSEKAISKRIDANVLDIEMKELSIGLDKTKFRSKLKTIMTKTNGKLIVRQFPTGTCTSNHIKALLHEIKLKKGFTPDVIILDYINIFASSRLPASAMTSPYIYIKAICEEMRAVAVEFDCCVLSAVQNNRGSVKKTTDVGLDDMADSFGIAMTADWVGALIQTEELREMCKYLIKTVKTRFDENNDKVYTVGVVFNKMRLTNLDDSEQEIPLHIKDQLKVQKEQKRKKENENIVAEVAFDFS